MWDLEKTIDRRAKRTAEAAELLRVRGYDCSQVKARLVAIDAFGSRYVIVSCNPYEPAIGMVRMAEGRPPLQIAE